MTDSTKDFAFAVTGIALAKVMKVGENLCANALWRVRELANDAQTLSSALQAEFPALPIVSASALHTAVGIYRKCEEAHVKSIPITADFYPRWLRAIDNPPPILFAKGNLSVLTNPPGVSIVGTRKATPNGEIIASRLAQYFAKQQWNVVSGLAFGIDAAAHKGLVEVGGIGIVVLAHGLEKASPRANAGLADEILLRGGLWVSEHAVGMPAKPEFFVQRNRIQIGLSSGSIIVEGEPKSGTTTQAEFCAKAKRPLFVVMPDPAGPDLGLLSSGPRELMTRLGATPIFSKSDYQAVLAKLEQSRAAITAPDEPARLS